MATGQMPGLVREHADDLVRRLRLKDRAVIDEDAAAVGDERVERTVVDDHHLDVLLLQTPRRAGSGACIRAAAARSRYRAGPAAFCCARAAGSGSSAIAAAVTRAVRAEAFLRNAIWNDIKRSWSNGLDSSFVIGFGDWRRTGYAICPYERYPYEPYNAASLGRKRSVFRTGRTGPPAK